MMLLMGQPTFVTPPAYASPASAPAFTIYLTLSKIELLISGFFDSSFQNIIVWSTPPTKRNKPTITQIRRYVTLINTPATSLIDITAAWQTATGVPYNPLTSFPNSNIFICLQNVSKTTGITSPMLCNVASTLSISNLAADNGNFLTTDGGDLLYTDQLIP
jgi:hypothetical protein